MKTIDELKDAVRAAEERCDESKQCLKIAESNRHDAKKALAKAQTDLPTGVIDGDVDDLIRGESEPETVRPTKYQRVIKGTVFDVYNVLKAYEVTCPARAHAIKKLLMPGKRGAKSFNQDMREAIQAIERAIELEGE